MSKRNSLFALCAGVLVLGATAASAQAIFSAGPATGDQLFLDQSTGAISWCQTLVNPSGSAPTPAGVCTKLGAATPSATNPSLIMSEPVSTGTAGQFTFLVTNVYTGKVTQCVFYYNSGLHSVYSSCAFIANVPT